MKVLVKLDWEQRKLGKIAQRIRGNDGRMDLPLLTISARQGWLTQQKRFSNNIAGKEKKNYTLLRKNQLSYNHGNSKAAIYGTVYSLKDYQEALVPKIYHSFSLIDNNSSKFIESYFHTKKLDRQLRKYISSTARMDGLLNISFSDFMKILLFLPSYNEQIRISKLMISVSKLVTLQQRKLEQLKLLKKDLLQNLFTDDKYPNVRFKGFNDPWEQHKLGELANIVRGASPRPIKDPKWFDEASDIGWLRISDVTEQNGRVHHLSQHISKLGETKTRILTEPHILLSIAATVGKPLINYCKTGVHDGFLIFQDPHFNLEFMFQWLTAFEHKWQRYGQPGSQVNLNSNIVKNQIVYIPSVQEQEMIGKYLSRIDNLITLQQHKLQQLKVMKKFLLQKLFI